MHVRKWGLVVLALVGGAMTASVASADPPEKHGKLYHKAVCGHGNPHDTARCHAHVLTDAAGDEIDGMDVVTMRNRPECRRVLRMQCPRAMVRRTFARPTTSPPTARRRSRSSTPTATRTPSAISAVYRSQFGLPACTTANGCFSKVNQNGVQGSYPATDTGWARRSALDLDMASAMCPGCKIVLVEATTPPTPISPRRSAPRPRSRRDRHLATATAAARSGTTSYEASYNQPGIAVTVSTGDSGYGVQFPASSPHVIAVGGTHLVRAGEQPRLERDGVVWCGSGCSTRLSPSRAGRPTAAARSEW